MSFDAGFSKLAISTRRIANAGLERIHSTTTNLGQKLFLHRHSPLKPTYAKQVTKALDSDIRAAQELTKKHLGKRYNPTIHRGVERETKRKFVQDAQVIAPKGVPTSPEEREKTVGSMRRKERFEMGAEKRKAVDDYLKTHKDE